MPGIAISMRFELPYITTNIITKLQYFDNASSKSETERRITREENQTKPTWYESFYHIDSLWAIWNYYFAILDLGVFNILDLSLILSVVRNRGK